MITLSVGWPLLTCSILVPSRQTEEERNIITALGLANYRFHTAATVSPSQQNVFLTKRPSQDPDEMSARRIVFLTKRLLTELLHLSASPDPLLDIPLREGCPFFTDLTHAHMLNIPLSLPFARTAPASLSCLDAHLRRRRRIQPKRARTSIRRRWWWWRPTIQVVGGVVTHWSAQCIT